MNYRRLLLPAALLAALPAAAATVDDLRSDLSGAAEAAGPTPPLEPADALEDALDGKERRVVEEVADGLIAAVYEGGGETAVVLVASPRKEGAYLLPAGKRLAFRDLVGEALEPGSVMPGRVVIARTPSAWEGLQYYARLSPVVQGEVEVTGAAVDESVAFEVVTVSADGRAGTEATLAEGLQRAQKLLEGGKNARVEVHPGLYREGGLSLPGNLEAETTGTLVIEGVGDGEAILTGADDFSGGWSEVPGAPGVWSKPWPHRFGMGGQPWARWGFLLPAEACRAEVLMVDGELFLPVMLEKFAWVDPDGAVPLSDFDDGSNELGRWDALGVRPPADLPAGGYAVVESDGVIYARPEEGVDLNAASVEAAVRPQILSLPQRRDTVLRNLTFRHTVNHPGGTADGGRFSTASIGGRNVLVEDCRFLENGAHGLSLDAAATDVTIRGCAFNANGWKGLAGGFQPENVLYENNESSSNNWRGHMGGEHSWDAAGVKIFGVNSTRGIAVRGHRSFANLTHGFWLDQSFVPYAPVVIENGVFFGNRFGAELYLEKLTGPVEVRGNVVWNSAGLYGVNGTSWNLHFSDNLMYAEGDRPVWFLHRRGNESDYANASKDWLVENNRVLAASPGSTFFHPDMTAEQAERFVETYRAGNNRYEVAEGAEGADGAEPFFDRNQRPIGFEAWARLTGSEEGSTATAFAEPEDPLSAEDRARFEAAEAVTRRFLAIAAAVEPGSGPPFERVQQAVGNNVVPLNLTAYLNRPLVGADAFIGAGQTLPQLSEGRHVFAGVPFDVADPAGGAEASVALRSAKVPGAESVEVPLGGDVSAVYVLHAAGWVVDSAEPFGRYELVYADGSTAGLDVAADRGGAKQPLVGDWYPTFDAFDNKVTRHAKLRPSEAGVGANLYVVEVANPDPAKEVVALRLSGDPEKDPSLIVLGVTALRR